MEKKMAVLWLRFLTEIDERTADGSAGFCTIFHYLVQFRIVRVPYYI